LLHTVYFVQTWHKTFSARARNDARQQCQAKITERKTMILAPRSANALECSANADTVEWPPSVYRCFDTLTEMLRETAPSATDVLQIPTASDSDVLVFLGCIAEWHTQNDLLFESFLARKISVVCWHARRDAAVVAFDKHFCGAAMARGRGFFGDLLRSADYLGAEWLLCTLVLHVNHIVTSTMCDKQQLESVCNAMFQ
jgi:hypothetical protein